MTEELHKGQGHIACLQKEVTGNWRVPECFSEVCEQCVCACVIKTMYNTSVCCGIRALL